MLRNSFVILSALGLLVSCVPKNKLIVQEFSQESLRVELRKVPGINSSLIFQKLTEHLNSSAAESQNQFYKLIFEVGGPKKSYSAVLQAAAWLIEKGENPVGRTLYQILDSSWDLSDMSRWGNYDVVIERLNSPALIDYYEQKRFTYSWVPVGGQREAFMLNKGTCDEISMFGFDALTKAGFKARIWNPPRKNPTRAEGLHNVVLFKDKDNRLYVIDNGRPYKKGVVPYNEYKVGDWRE